MMNSYMTVNLETAGLSPKTNKTMEVGAIKVVDGQVAGELHTVVHSRRQLEEEIVELTSIGDEMLRDAPGIEEIIGQVAAFCRGSPLVGHRIMFDYSFLKRATASAGLEFGKGNVDTLELRRKFVPEEERKNLGAAYRYFRVETGTAHRALSGAQVASGLYQELMRHHGKGRPEASEPKTLICKIKKRWPATKR